MYLQSYVMFVDAMHLDCCVMFVDDAVSGLKEELKGEIDVLAMSTEGQDGQADPRHAGNINRRQVDRTFLQYSAHCRFVH